MYADDGTGVRLGTISPADTVSEWTTVAESRTAAIVRTVFEVGTVADTDTLSNCDTVSQFNTLKIRRSKPTPTAETNIRGISGLRGPRPAHRCIRRVASRIKGCFPAAKPHGEPCEAQRPQYRPSDSCRQSALEA